MVFFNIKLFHLELFGLFQGVDFEVKELKFAHKHFLATFDDIGIRTVAGERGFALPGIAKRGAKADFLCFFNVYKIHLAFIAAALRFDNRFSELLRILLHRQQSRFFFKRQIEIRMCNEVTREDAALEGNAPQADTAHFHQS